MGATNHIQRSALKLELQPGDRDIGPRELAARYGVCYDAAQNAQRRGFFYRVGNLAEKKLDPQNDPLLRRYTEVSQRLDFIEEEREQHRLDFLEKIISLDTATEPVADLAVDVCVMSPKEKLVYDALQSCFFNASLIARKTKVSRQTVRSYMYRWGLGTPREIKRRIEAE